MSSVVDSSGMVFENLLVSKMKNLLSISLLTVYLFSSTEVNQVLDIPELLNHYKQHHAADSNINFVNFLVMHYCTDDGVTADDATDNKLPFKQIHRFGFIFYTSSLLYTEAERKFVLLEKANNSLLTVNSILPVYPNKHKHPPRFIS